MEPAKKKFLALPILKNQKGFTLHETLTALAFISVGILGFALSTTGLVRGNYVSATFTIATHLAEDKIEELKVQRKLNNTNNCSAGGGGADSPDLKLSPTGGSGGIYDRCWAISDFPLSAGLKRIDVTVSWLDSVSRSITLSTLIYRE